MKKKYVANAVVARLPVYYRWLKEQQEFNISRVSSMEISNALHFTASQVRQDFSNFGEFGQQGHGYDVRYLTEQIRLILGLNRQYNLIVVGGGKIGQALASYTHFMSEGVKVCAVFDINIAGIKVPSNVEVLTVDKMCEYIKANNIDIAAITTQRDVAQQIADKVIACGVKAIWNFAPITLKTQNVAVENLHMSESLFLLSYKLNKLENESDEEVE